jgi:hypothetical protein
MLFKIKNQHANICVLRISNSVLDLPDVIVTDRNASSGYARFAPAPGGIRIVDCDLVFAKYWTHPDPIKELHRGSVICAEVLVPDRVDSSYIIGAYASGDNAKKAFESMNTGIPIIINSHLFFR